MTTQGKTLSRDYKHVKKHTPGTQTFTGWMGLLAGLAIGLTVALGRVPALPEPAARRTGAQPPGSRRRRRARRKTRRRPPSIRPRTTRSTTCCRSRKSRCRRRLKRPASPCPACRRATSCCRLVRSSSPRRPTSCRRSSRSTASTRRSSVSRSRTRPGIECGSGRSRPCRNSRPSASKLAEAEVEATTISPSAGEPPP